MLSQTGLWLCPGWMVTGHRVWSLTDPSVQWVRYLARIVPRVPLAPDCPVKSGLAWTCRAVICVLLTSQLHLGYPPKTSSKVSWPGCDTSPFPLSTSWQWPLVLNPFCQTCPLQDGTASGNQWPVRLADPPGVRVSSELRTWSEQTHVVG